MTEALLAFHRIIDAATDELADTATSSNIARRHHLESAVEAFADIGKLLEAERIVRELFEPEYETPPAS